MMPAPLQRAAAAGARAGDYATQAAAATNQSINQIVIYAGRRPDGSLV
jgi:hypothetical protein